MNRADVVMRDIAETVVLSDIMHGSINSDALSYSLGKLRSNLVILMGHGGVRALGARALYVASRASPALRTVTVRDDGTFEGLSAADDGLNEGDVQAARVSLLTEIFLLLLQFLGPGVTLAVISDSWPNASFDHVDLSWTGDA